MTVTGIDGEEYLWRYYNYQKKRPNASKLHVRARELVKKIYPFSSICEEILLVGTLKERLYLDLYVHQHLLAIEVHGEQHYTYNSFFYGSKLEFARAQARDRTKVEWCKINRIDLVELPYDESDELWESRIRNRSLC